ncbi:MAG TPA: FecR domain-containing protein [Puia sp.]|nr:FecR domain-containing protein [Puia sp.]
MKDKLAYLFERYLKNTSTEEELEEFLSYVKQAEHDQSLRDLIRDAYNNIQETDPAVASYIDGNGSLVLKTSGADLPNTYRPQRSSKRKWLLPAGSLLLLLVIIPFLWWQGKNKAPGRHEQMAVQSLTRKITETSEQKFLLLPDSTQVWLNGDSYLEFPDEFTDKKREVYLSGEAWFDVKHAEEIPFIIHTGKITTTVMGTAFNIKAYPYLRTVVISVSRGKIRVSRGTEVVAVLEKGQQVKVSNTDSLIREKNIDVGKIASWQQGYISYEDETLGEILRDLEHLYNTGITVADQSLLNMRITTSFNRSVGKEEALKIICKLVDKQLSNRNGQYIIE